MEKSIADQSVKERVFLEPVRLLRHDSFIKLFQRVKTEGLIPISNKRANDLLARRIYGGAQIERIDYAFRTGTMTAYAEPGKRIGSAIEGGEKGVFIRHTWQGHWDGSPDRIEQVGTLPSWVFEVPPGLRNLKNVLLVAEYPNYELEEDEAKNRIVVHPQEKGVIVSENFPTKCGDYGIDPRTGITINKPLEERFADTSLKESEKDKWYLDRNVWYLSRNNEPRVGVINHICNYQWRSMDLSSHQSSFRWHDTKDCPELGMIVEYNNNLEPAKKQQSNKEN